MLVRTGVRHWLVITCLFLATLTTGCSRNYGVEITLPSQPEITGKIYVGGNVASPGFYPLKDTDTLKDLLQAAGAKSFSELTSLELYVRPIANEPQKVDINRAEAWLLQSLPEIGEVTAGRIIDYRNSNGLFRSINELTRVEGIGAATFEKIKAFITVSD